MDEQTTRWQGPPLSAWRAWTLARALVGLDVPWCVAGGWALDLFLGQVTRPHEDLEMELLRSDFEALRRHLTGCRSYGIGSGEVIALEAGEAPPLDKHQCWVLDVASGCYRVDAMLQAGDRATWVYRRDPGLREPRARVVARREGIPYLRPEVVLLFKAKHRREKDDADFDRCLPHLDPTARTWLGERLGELHPDHGWIERLCRAR